MEAGQEGVARRENRAIDEAERNRRAEPRYGLVVASDERLAICEEQCQLLRPGRDLLQWR